MEKKKESGRAAVSYVYHHRNLKEFQQNNGSMRSKRMKAGARTTSFNYHLFGTFFIICIYSLFSFNSRNVP